MQLPKVSIIIVFFDEYLSVLLRAVHSIYNRTPRELLVEIILVNDGSTIVELYEPLHSYVKQNFKGLVTILTMKDRRGLVVGRLEAARKAKGEVLVGVEPFKAIRSDPLITFSTKGFLRCSSRG